MAKPDKPTPSTKSLYKTMSPQLLFWVSFVFCVIAVTLFAATLFMQNGDFDAQPTAGYPLGATARFPQSTVTISDVKTSEGSGRFIAPEGSTYLVLTMTVTNISKAKITVLPSLDTYLKDEQGVMTYLTPLALDHPFRAGPILPGDTVKGQLSYLVRQVKDQSFYIDAVWTAGVAKFSLD